MVKLNRKLGKSYKKVGTSYHLGRKDYPRNLIEDIITISGIDKESVILDIGCGTGKSTIPFAKKGYTLTGIDMSKNMLGVAKKLSIDYRNVHYKRISFENFSPPPASFDLVLAGSAIHWIHPTIAYKRIVKILKKDGSIAIFWRLIDHDSTKFLLKIRELFIKYCSGYYHSAPSKDRARRSVNIILERLMMRKEFTKPLVKKYISLERYTKPEFINLVRSYSWVASLNKKKKDLFMQELKNVLDKEQDYFQILEKFYLILAKRK